MSSSCLCLCLCRCIVFAQLQFAVRTKNNKSNCSCVFGFASSGILRCCKRKTVTILGQTRREPIPLWWPRVCLVLACQCVSGNKCVCGKDALRWNILNAGRNFVRNVFLSLAASAAATTHTAHTHRATYILFASRLKTKKSNYFGLMLKRNCQLLGPFKKASWDKAKKRGERAFG